MVFRDLPVFCVYERRTELYANELIIAAVPVARD